MLLGLFRGVFRSHLRGERGRLARAFEALASGRRPGNRVPLGIRYGDQRVVERRADMRYARGYVFAFTAANTSRCLTGHRLFVSVNLFLFTGDRARFTLARTRIRMGALTANRQVPAVAETPVAGHIHRSFPECG